MTHTELDLLALAGAVPAGEHATWRALLAADPGHVPPKLGRRPKAEPKPPEAPRVAPEIIRGETVHETCILNKGSHSAREIGEQLGITRNAVIGHWYRATIQKVPKREGIDA